MPPGDPSIQPLELDLDRLRQLRIRWADGHNSVLPLVLLRQNCPCATCRTERDERARNPLRIVQVPADERDLITASDAQLVGRYALRIVWKDGHETGIYDFATLRRLDPAANASGP